jgi:hypothetical protein
MVLFWMEYRPRRILGRLRRGQRDEPHSQFPLPTHGLKWCSEAATWQFGLPVPDTQQSTETIFGQSGRWLISADVQTCHRRLPCKERITIPGWRSEEHLGADNKYRSVAPRRWAADCHGAGWGIHWDRNAELVALAAHDLDLVPLGS